MHYSEAAQSVIGRQPINKKTLCQDMWLFMASQGIRSRQFPHELEIRAFPSRGMFSLPKSCLSFSSSHWSTRRTDSCIHATSCIQLLAACKVSASHSLFGNDASLQQMLCDKLTEISASTHSITSPAQDSTWFEKLLRKSRKSQCLLKQLQRSCSASFK